MSSTSNAAHKSKWLRGDESEWMNFEIMNFFCVNNFLTACEMARVNAVVSGSMRFVVAGLEISNLWSEIWGRLLYEGSIKFYNFFHSKFFRTLKFKFFMIMNCRLYKKLLLGLHLNYLEKKIWHFWIFKINFPLNFKEFQ